MDWPEIVGGMVSTLFIGVFFYLAGKGTVAPQEKTKEGTYFLRTNKIYYYFGLFSCSIFIIAIAATLYFDPSQFLIAFIVCFLIFGITGIYLVLFYKNCWLEFDEHKITSGTIYGKSKTMNWNEVKNVSFGKISGYIKLKSASELVKVHFHMVGLVEFLRMIEKQTEFKVADLKLPI